MIRSIRKPRFLKIVSVLMAILFINEIIFPTVAMALTGGPSQPEVESFTPIEATDMVDLFSGDFKYNIPLMDVDGYPININYNSNITMDQEASWVGLGWNLNPGVINRSMRGIPDEFCGDNIKKEFNIKPNITIGIGGSFKKELVGFGGLGLGVVLKYNSYLGFIGESVTSAKIGPKGSGKALTGSLNVGIASSSESGLTITPSISLEYMSESDKRSKKFNFEVGLPMNTIGGIKQLQIDAKCTRKEFKQTKDDAGNIVPALDANENKIVESERSGSADLGFGLKKGETYTPQISMPMKYYFFDFGINGGFLKKISDNFVGLRGFYTEQSLKEKEKNIPAYGYLNTKISYTNTNALLDINREQDEPFYTGVQYLPVTNYTYDYYQVAGQGVAGSFRSYSTQVGYVFDNSYTNTSTQGNLNIDFSLGDIVKGGVDININKAKTESGLWCNYNNNTYSYISGLETDNEYSHIKATDELNVEPENDPYINNIGNYRAVKLEVVPLGWFDAELSKKYTNGNGWSYENPNDAIRRTQRIKRNQLFTMLNAYDAGLFGLDKNIRSYTPNDFSNTPTSESLTRSRINGTSHHPSELSILKDDGSRYVYGIPAYNLKQVETSFAVGNEGTINREKGLVTYNSGQDSKSNSSGGDCFFSKTTIPAYAHSYLLTAVLSPDYVDITGDGPTNDDIGNYVKFNYSKLPNSYNWRIPYEKDNVNFDEGYYFKPSDNKGNYLYGEKELWYVYSIETRNYIAEFSISNREDGLGVQDHTGGIDLNMRMKKLDKITLYSKNDRKINGNAAIPVKEVHFEYTYDLCKNIPNNKDYNISNDTGPGKLTLKKIYFTYGNSKRGKLNPYQFSYRENDSNFNPNYQNRGYDRWGNYMPPLVSSIPNSTLYAYEYPYVNQDTIPSANPLYSDNHYYADVYSSVWNLTEIKTPSGAKIKVKYGADDYAYVQNRRAMQMVKVVGVINDLNDNAIKSELYQGTTFFGYNFLYVLFEIPKDYHYTDEDAFKKDFCWGINDLYYKFFVKLSGATNNDCNMESIRGYANATGSGTTTIGGVKYGYVTLASDDDLNPISKQAYKFIMRNARHLAYSLADPDDKGSAASIIKALSKLLFVTDLVDFIKNPSAKQRMRNKELCRLFDPHKSWIRINSPTYSKKGGGSRVERLEVTDNWDNQGKSYAQKYDYTMKETLPDGRMKTISSGVAAYEPMTGGDENPFKLPKTFTKENGEFKWDEEGFFEEPFGESYFPTAQVGYRKVTVYNEKNPQIKTHGTGKTVHYFYTAKEFPTITDQTTLSQVHRQSGILKILKIVTNNYMNVSQGYAVIGNDMHGKPKSVEVFSENNNEKPISRRTYEYKMTSENALINTVPILNKNGLKSNGTLGVDVDMVNDFRHQETTTKMFGTQANLLLFFAAIFPFPLPSFLPSYAKDIVSFSSSVTTKFTYRHGLLSKVISEDLSSVIRKENLVYDAETGEVLLSETQNEFNDAIYEFNQPAWWVYKQMGPAYKNTGICFNNITITNGKSFISGATNYFGGGDELLIGSNLNAWVLDVKGDSISVIDRSGSPVYCSNKSVRIIKSGFKNQLGEKSFSMISKADPIPHLRDQNLWNSAKVIDAKVTEYDNYRKVFCGDSISPCITKLNPTVISLTNFFNALVNNHEFINCNSTSIIDTVSTINNYQNYLYNYLGEMGLPQTSMFWNANTDNNSIYCNLSEHAILPTSSTHDISLNLSHLINGDSIYWIGNPKPNTNEECFTNNKFMVYIKLKNKTTGVCYTDSAGVIVSDPFIGTIAERVSSPFRCNLNSSNAMNPYITGMLSQWYPKRTYTYLTNRIQTHQITTQGNLKEDGYYDKFMPYWKLNSTFTKWEKTSSTDWVWDKMVSVVSPEGNEVESVDALNQYSSALFGYNRTLPIALAQNARQKDILFDGFEDYLDNNACTYCTRHHKFDVPLDVSFITANASHTGKYSLSIPNGQTITLKIPLNLKCSNQKISDSIANLNDTKLINSYKLDDNDCMKGFSPDVETSPKSYLISGWFKNTGANLIGLTSQSGSMNIIDFKIANEPIEGWYRFEARLNINQQLGASTLELELNNLSTNRPLYVDDIRIHPINANMKTFVFHPINKKMSAELDDNNYATFYEYDEDGSLSQVKKETEKGIFTVKTIRKGLVKTTQP